MAASWRTAQTDSPFAAHPRRLRRRRPFRARTSRSSGGRPRRAGGGLWPGERRSQRVAARRAPRGAPPRRFRAGQHDRGLARRARLERARHHAGRRAHQRFRPRVRRRVRRHPARLPEAATGGPPERRHRRAGLDRRVRGVPGPLRLAAVLRPLGGERPCPDRPPPSHAPPGRRLLLGGVGAEPAHARRASRLLLRALRRRRAGLELDVGVGLRAASRRRRRLLARSHRHRPPVRAVPLLRRRAPPGAR